MRWRVMLEVAGADGTRQMHEIGAGERPTTAHAAATPGLSLEEGKMILAALQRHLVAPQVDERACKVVGGWSPLG